MSLWLKYRWTRSFPTSPMWYRSSGWVQRYSMAPLMASRCMGGTQKPAGPRSSPVMPPISSLQQPTSVVTQGRPAAKDSSTDRGWPSEMLVRMVKSNCCIFSSTFTVPGNSTSSSRSCFARS